MINNIDGFKMGLYFVIILLKIFFLGNSNYILLLIMKIKSYYKYFLVIELKLKRL